MSAILRVTKWLNIGSGSFIAIVGAIELNPYFLAPGLLFVCFGVFVVPMLQAMLTRRTNYMEVIEYKPPPVDCLKGNWCVYEVTVRMPDGAERNGTMQGDTHLWAPETFEAD